MILKISVLLNHCFEICRRHEGPLTFYEETTHFKYKCSTYPTHQETIFFKWQLIHQSEHCTNSLSCLKQVGKASIGLKNWLAVGCQNQSKIYVSKPIWFHCKTFRISSFSLDDSTCFTQKHLQESVKGIKYKVLVYHTKHF